MRHLNDTMPVVLGRNPPSLVQYLPTSLSSPSADCVEAVFTFYLQVWTVHGGNELTSSIFDTMPPLRVWYIPTNLSCSPTDCLEAAFNRNFRPVRGGNESGCFNSAYLIYTYRHAVLFDKTQMFRQKLHRHPFYILKFQRRL